MGTSAVAPREPVTQQVPYFRAAIAYNTLNISVAGKVPLGTLPAGAIVTDLLIRISEAFNAGTSNEITIGTADDDDSLLTSVDLDELEVDTTEAFVAKGYKVTVDTPLFIKYTQTGTAASAGAADIMLTFIPDNDR